MINFQKCYKGKIQLTVAINLISSKDVDEEHVMHSKSNNLWLMIMQMMLLINFSSHFFQDTKVV